MINYNSRIYNMTSADAKWILNESITDARDDSADHVKEYFRRENITKVAIYGMGEVGKRLYDFIEKETEVEVAYGIEKLNYQIKGQYRVKYLYRDFFRGSGIDAILVTPVQDYARVADELYDVIDDDCKIIPANEIFWKKTDFKLDFICPGFPRSGTTSFDAILRQNSRICMPKVKEPQFFSDCAQYCRGLGWYAENYYGVNSEKVPGKIYGEVNPSLGYKNVRKIKDCFGSLKVIILYRNPIDWMFSFFKLIDKWFQGKFFLENQLQYINIAQGFESLVKEIFEENKDGTVKMKKWSIFSEHDYIQMYEAYKNVFGEANVKVVLFEDLINETEQVCKDIFEFIGADTDDIINYKQWKNKGDLVPINEEGRKRFHALYQEQQRFAVLHEEERQESLKVCQKRKAELEQYYTKNNETPTSYTVDILKKYYRPYKEYIEKILNRDLSDIWF